MDASRRKYRVDSLRVNTITFRAPHALLDRNDVVVCIEYSLRKCGNPNNIYTDYRVWCRFASADTAKMIYSDSFNVDQICGSVVAIEGCILNEILHSQPIIRKLQEFAQAKKLREESQI